jgi:phosphatidylglycerophosphatase C
VRAWSAEFADGLGEGDLNPGALTAIARHRDAGDRLVLLSASVDLYVPEIGRRFGFHETIATGVAWRNGKLEGSLTTENRRGDEKRRCIEALRRNFPGVRIAAYANAASDFPHLAISDEPVLVNGRIASRREAQRRGIPTENWRDKRVPMPAQSA